MTCPPTKTQKQCCTNNYCSHSNIQKNIQRPTLHLRGTGGNGFVVFHLVVVIIFISVQVSASHHFGQRCQFLNLFIKVISKKIIINSLVCKPS